MRVANQSLILILGIVASSSTASSFGTHSSKAVLQHIRKPLPRAGNAFVNIRGGSDAEAASPVPTPVQTTELSAQASDEPEPVEEVYAPPVEEVYAPTPVVVEETKALNVMGPNSTAPGVLRRLFPSFPWHTLPDLLTYTRCLAIPALVFQFYRSTHVDKNMHSALIFAIASITDYLDGFLARRWDICSPFGAFLDPVADKLMVSTALILLAGKYGAVVAIPSTIILAREIAVSALREWMASRGSRDSVKVGFQGKCKTALTMMALSVILAVPDGWSVAMAAKKSLGWDLVMNVGMIMLYMSAFVTVTSGSVYFKAAAPVLMGKK